MRAIVYARVSTDEQGASGLGLEAQAHACRLWAEREAVGVAEVHRDEVSGAAPLGKRPGLLAALDALEDGDVLLVARRDRLGRDPIVMALIEAAVARKGGRVVSAAGEGTDGDDPTSVLMRRMVDAFAEYERLVIRARTRAALGAKRVRGERVGSVPYGATLGPDGRTLVPNPAELAVLVDVRAWDAEGWSLRRIAAELEARSVPTKNGRPWSFGTVRRLLERPDP